MHQEDDYATRYHIDDIAKLDANDSHPIIMDFITGTGSLLDVGCATGCIGNSLQGRGMRLVGLEVDPVAAEQAQPYYDQFIVGDVTSPEVLNQLENNAFDTIVLGDVIEHLIDPWAFVRAITEKLAQDGNLIISIPNLGHASVIASLLAGNFNYRDMGLLDATHVRFFGLQSLCALVMDAGLTPMELRRVRHGIFATEIPVETERLPARLVPMLELCPDARTYQFIIKARKSAPHQDINEFVRIFSLPLSDSESDEQLLQSCLSELEKHRLDLRGAREYISTCTTTIKEKDSLIDSLAMERADLQRSAQDSAFLKSDNQKLQKQLAVQHQKTSELTILSERLRSEAKASPASQQNAETGTAPLLDIIIPVYNAFDETRRCLDSVLRNTDERHRIYLIDDASTDPRIGKFLTAQAERHDRIHFVRNGINRGFIKTVNSALVETRGDVIVLNSDTIVTEGWAEKILAAAMSEPSVGMVCPLSNNATILSVPSMNENNCLSPGISVDQFARIVEEVSLRSYPRIPTAVGFCMYISRKCLSDTGPLDEVFGLGYGEENDFAMRAQKRGYCIKIADDAFVFHSGSTSFQTVAGDLDQRKIDNEKLLNQRWPQYHKTILAFCILNPLREIQQRVHDGISRRIAGNQPHVMQLLHNYHTNAGTELHTRQLAEGLYPFFRSTVFFPDSEVVNSDAHTSIADGNVMELRYARRNLASDILFDNAASSTTSVIVETNFERILRNSDVRIVHFQHMLNFGTFNLPLIAKNLGIKVVMTLHDYFYLCPVYNLVKQNRSAMCRRLGPDVEAEECYDCFQDKLIVESKEQSSDLKAFLGAYFHRRRAAITEALGAANLLIAPSGYVKEKYCQGLGREIGERIVVVPHGVAVANRQEQRPRNRQLQVTFLGNATGIKGYEVFGEAARRLKNRPVIMQSFGAGVQELLQRYRHEVKNKGPYQPRDLAEIFRNSDVVVVPSLWEETFCLTMSEAFAHGVPVIASDVGAMSERVHEGKNGFLFPVGDVDRLVELINRLMDNPSLLSQMKGYCMANPPRSVEDMMEQYRGLYDDLLNNRVDRLELHRKGLEVNAVEIDREENPDKIVLDAVGA
jgi:glycosyltransferase involved in cell wall biosynthesis/GT2 family glycosyltransferase/2-polyprenyl-3-methyl-5-hydroxy-6-metoxy-1,4-benzoquinol methylase